MGFPRVVLGLSIIFKVRCCSGPACAMADIFVRGRESVAALLLLGGCCCCWQVMLMLLQNVDTVAAAVVML